jgi:hypothetical protein
MIQARRPGGQRAGRVRSARLTDLAALGELSRLSHAEEPSPDSRMRTLGLPVASGHIGFFSLFRLPLRAVMPGDLLYVYEEHGRVAGLARVERDGMREEWTIVELDAVDNGTAGDIRFRLVQRLLRDASRRGSMRFHVACADQGGNVELFMQAGFARYGEERILYHPPQARAPRPAESSEAAARGIRPCVPLDALALDRLYRRATPAPVSRLENYRQHDWERQGGHWRVPRSSLTPILRFADVEAFVQAGQSKGGDDLVGFCQVGVAKEDQPHYIRLICLPDHDPAELISFGLSIIAERAHSRWTDRAASAVGLQRPDRGIVSAVRTYESPLEHHLEEHGFSEIARVSLLMREMAVRVTEPAMVPAATR